MQGLDFVTEFSTLSPRIAAIASELQSLILDLYPDADITRDKNDVGYGAGSGYRGLIFVISPHSAHVTLGIARAAELEDPAGLLQGTGKVHRHVKLTRPEQVRDPELEALMRRALQAASERLGLDRT